MSDIGEVFQQMSDAAMEPAKHQSPEDIIAGIIADGRGAGSDGMPRIGRATRKKAHKITKALRDAGWRIIR